MPRFTLSSEITVDRLRPDKDTVFTFVATADDCHMLAKRFGFLAVNALSARLKVFKSARHCWEISGQMNGDVVQACGVTGAPVSETIDFPLEERYVRQSRAYDEVEVALDGAEPLENGIIDLGEMLAQSLAVAVTPWPRADDAPESFKSGDIMPDHPFAGLAVLKGKSSK